MKPLSAVLVSLALLAGPINAAPKAKEAYLCKMDYVSSDGFVAPELAFWVFPDGSAQVLDPLINHYEGKPRPAILTRDTDKRIEFTWTLDGVEVGPRGQTGHQVLSGVKFVAAYRRTTGVFTYHAVLPGFDNRPNAKGRCTPIKR